MNRIARVCQKRAYSQSIINASLIIAFALSVGSSFFTCLWAAEPADGKVYRLVSRYYPTLAATEDISSNGIVTRAIGTDTDFEQLWQLKANGTGYTLTNLLTERTIYNYGGENNQYWTNPDEAHTFQIVSAGSDWWTIRHNSSMGGLHAAWTGKVVYWHDNAAEATQWKLQEVTRIAEEELSIQRLNYQHYTDLANNEKQYNEALTRFFTDGSCAELRPTYATLSDEALADAMAAQLPKEFIDMAIKVKNEAWAHREKEFRIRSYQAYSDPDYWYEVLLTTRWGRINNPTGIYGNAGDILYVFVGDAIPAGATLQLEFIQGTETQGTAVPLHQGLNVLTVAADESSCFVQYVGTTSPDGDRLITDYPPIRIHIENGIVNGFWNIDEHTDEDWADILSHATAPVIEVKGHRAMYHMHTSVFRKLCPTGIHDAIDWWEDMLEWQHDLIGDGDYVPSKCNNMACAITLDDDHTYMAATWYRTQYHVDVAYKVLNHSTVMTDADYCFGPAHENGHMNQGAINYAGGTESSNSIHANLIVYKLGKYLTRGPANADAFGEYAEGLPWVKRDAETYIRMLWQLYLYFHLCEVDTDFYPNLFKAMRKTPLAIRWGNKSSVNASEDILLIAKNCCDVAQLDLSDFFRVYGVLTPHEKTETHESNTYLTTTQKEIDAFLAHVSQYPKAQPIEFIDDRIKGMPRSDGGEGFRLTYDLCVGQCGDVGQYTDFMDLSVKAEGYIWSRSGNNITIKNGMGAVGFRLRDKATGEQIYLSNAQKFVLPTPCRNIPFEIVAVQADGTEVHVPSTAEAGTEAEQLAALKASLSSAKTLLDLKDDEGGNIGWYYGFALADLQAMYEAALAAQQQADQSVHTYGQWSILLDEVVSATLHQTNISIPLFPENVYAFYEAAYKNYSLDYYATGPKATALSPDEKPSKLWMFVPADKEDTYYIYNTESGTFISYCEDGKRVKSQANDVKGAIAFRLKDYGNGLYALQIDGSDVYMSYNSAKEAVGTKTNAQPWRFLSVINRHAENISAQRDALLRMVGYINDEMATGNYVTRTDTLDALRQQLDATFDVVRNEWGKARPEDQLGGLWSAIQSVTAAFCPTALPEPSSDGQAIYYLLQNLSNGAFACYEGGTGRLGSRAILGTPTTPVDEQYLFRLVTAGESNQEVYIVHSSGNWTRVLSNYVCLGDSTDATPFSLAFNEESKGMEIKSDKGYWAGSNPGGYIPTRDAVTPWRLVKVLVNENTGIAPIHTDNDMSPQDTRLFDLTGRQATENQSLQSGIYIRNGRKVIIR